MASTRRSRPTIPPPPAPETVAPNQIQLVFNHADALDDLGRVDGYTETLRFRDGAGLPARRYSTRSGATLSWRADRPFIFFPVSASRWTLPSGSTPTPLLHADGSVAGWASSQEYVGSPYEILRLTPRGVAGEELFYQIMPGTALVPARRRAHAQRSRDFGSISPSIVRATIVLIG